MRNNILFPLLFLSSCSKTRQEQKERAAKAATPTGQGANEGMCESKKPVGPACKNNKGISQGRRVCGKAAGGREKFLASTLTKNNSEVDAKNFSVFPPCPVGVWVAANFADLFAPVVFNDDDYFFVLFDPLNAEFLYVGKQINDSIH